MCNFQEILSQLNQKQIAIFCDEGVYHIARHIKFVEEEKFKDIIFMLGNFHFTKVLLGCIGKYVRESGVENVFVETKFFGVNVVEQVLTGSSYNRSVKGFFLLGEALMRLLLRSFLPIHSVDKYDETLSYCTLSDSIIQLNKVTMKKQQ